MATTNYLFNMGLVPRSWNAQQVEEGKKKNESVQHLNDRLLKWMKDGGNSSSNQIVMHGDNFDCRTTFWRAFTGKSEEEHGFVCFLSMVYDRKGVDSDDDKIVSGSAVFDLFSSDIFDSSCVPRDPVNVLADSHKSEPPPFIHPDIHSYKS